MNFTWAKSKLCGVDASVVVYGRMYASEHLGTWNQEDHHQGVNHIPCLMRFYLQFSDGKSVFCIAIWNFKKMEMLFNLPA